MIVTLNEGQGYLNLYQNVDFSGLYHQSLDDLGFSKGHLTTDLFPMYYDVGHD